MATRSALIGRQAEREQLQNALERARLGSGSLVLLAGDAGVGKSRLAEEVARGSGAKVLWGAASRTAAVPYGPLAAGGSIALTAAAAASIVAPRRGGAAPARAAARDGTLA